MRVKKFVLCQKICSVSKKFGLRAKKTCTACKKNFLLGTLSHFLAHFLMFWHTFSTFGVLSHVLANFLNFWCTFSCFGTLSHTFPTFVTLSQLLAHLLFWRLFASMSPKFYKQHFCTYVLTIWVCNFLSIGSWHQRECRCLCRHATWFATTNPNLKSLVAKWKVFI